MLAVLLIISLISVSVVRVESTMKISILYDSLGQPVGEVAEHVDHYGSLRVDLKTKTSKMSTDSVLTGDFFNQNKTETKLTVSRDDSINEANKQYRTILTTKGSTIYKFIPCDALTVAKTNNDANHESSKDKLPNVPSTVISMLDCQPLAKHLMNKLNIDCSQATEAAKDPCKSALRADSNANYIVMATTKSQMIINSLLSKYVTASRSRFFPIEPSLVKQHLIGLENSYNLTSGLFAPGASNFGYFYQQKYTLFNGIGLHCDFMLYLSFNDTVHPELIPTSIPELIALLYKKRIQSGYMVHLTNWSCRLETPTGDPLLGFDISLDNDFLLVRRNEFPYLICDHTMKTSPFKGMFDYTGSIQQTTGLSGTKSLETTIIKLRGVSSFFADLNFILEQTIDSDWVEEMVLAHPQLNMLVGSNWSEGKFEKTMRVLLAKASGIKRLGESSEKLHEYETGMAVKFTNDEKKVGISFEFDKDVLNRIDSNQISQYELEENFENVRQWFRWENLQKTAETIGLTDFAERYNPMPRADHEEL